MVCTRASFSPKANGCDVWAPRLPEHGIVNGRGQPLQYQAIVGNSRIKVWRDWLEDLRSVLDGHSRPQRSGSLCHGTIRS